MAPSTPCWLTPEQAMAILYGYMPNLGAAIFGAVLFGMLAFASLYPTIRSRAWFFLLVTATALLEAIGYIGRAVVAADPPCNPLSGAYVMSSFLLVVSPTLVAIVEYSVIGRLLLISPAGRVGCMQAKHVIWFFSFSDAVTLVIQCAGGGLMSLPELQKIGTELMLAGLVTQLAFYFLFAVLVARVFCNLEGLGLAGRPQVKNLIISQYGSLILLAIRNVYRVVEFADFAKAVSGDHTASLTKGSEALYYGLDLVPVSLAILLLVVLHRGSMLQEIAANGPSDGSLTVAQMGVIQVAPAAQGAVGVVAQVCVGSQQHDAKGLSAIKDCSSSRAVAALPEQE